MAACSAALTYLNYGAENASLRRLLEDVRQGLRFLRSELPRILAGPSDVLSPRMVHIFTD